MYELKRGDMPYWYELTWDAEKCAIILEAEKKIFEERVVPQKDDLLVKKLTKDFKFKEFSRDIEDKYFGFEKCFKRIKDGKASYVRFLIPIPVLRTYKKEKCSKCKGSGKDRRSSWLPCMQCNGYKKEVMHDMRQCHAIAATIHLAVNRLCTVDKKTQIVPSEKHQLMVLMTGFDYERNGCGICGDCSKTMLSWLGKSTADQTCKPEMVTNAMIEANKKMGYGDVYGDKNFETRFHNDGQFSLQCPGNRCQIYIPFSAKQEDKGWEIEEHNVDDAQQQLFLLVALAQLCTLARRAGVQ